MTTTDSNTLPVLEAGREAYKRIQESGRMLRDDWRTVGEALLVGRAECLSPKTGKPNNKKFGEWCEANGFDSIPNTVRSNALWLAEEWDRVHSVLTPLQDSHPNNIRAAFRKATKITEEAAAKAMKLFRRADDEASSETEVAGPSLNRSSSL